MRQRLDLDALLRKYQTDNSPRQTFETGYMSPRTIQPKNKIIKLKTQANFYPENDARYYNTIMNQARPKIEKYSSRDKVSSSSFQMSKSECQNLLMNIKEELSSEEKGIQGHINECIGKLMQKFDKEHEELRRELINLVDHSLQHNKRAVFDMIESYRKQFPREYTSVGKKIAVVNEEINALLNGLNSNSYKKTIAEVVTKDFSQMIKRMRDQVSAANNNYRDGLTSIELDRSKLIIIQQSLQRIYLWRNKEEGVRVYPENEDPMRTSRRSRKIFEKGANKMAMTEREGRDGSQYSAPKRMRKTFFNFDAQN